MLSRRFGRGGALLAATLAAFISIPLNAAQAASPPVVVAGQASPGNTLAPSWSFTADAGATTDCRVLSGATTVADWAPCTSPYVADLTGQVDGTYTFEVQATDGGGSASTSDDYVLDTTAPGLPTVTTTPTTPGSGHSPTWQFTVPEGTSECRVVSGATTVADWAPCTSPYVADLTGQVDGTYTFGVRAVDAATNTGAAATSDYVLDTTAPAAPSVITVTGTPGNSTNPSFSFTGEALSTAHCRLVRGATEIVAVTTCTSPYSVDLSAEADGTYTLQVYVSDQAGNDGATATSDYVLDRVAPGTPSIDSDPGSLGKDTTPTWTFSGEAGAAFECQVVGPTSTSAYTPCTSPYTPTLSQGDGDYTVHVTATDPAGNTGGVATSTYTLDTTAPAAPSLSGPASPNTDPTPTVVIAAESGATTECRVDGPLGAGTYAGCSGPYTPALSQGDGSYVIRVRATDQAGNTGVAATFGYDLDTTGPAAPVVSGPSSPSANTSVSWTFTMESGATAECRLHGPSSTTAWAACTSPESRTLGQGDGSYTLEVRETDSLGNLGLPGSSPTYALDTTAPGAVSVTGPASPGKNTSVSFTFTAEAGSSVQCRLVGPTSTSAWAACTSPSAVTLTQGDGTYSFEAKATDTAGNTGPVGAANYVLDTQAPNAPTLSGPSSPGNSAAVSFSFTAEAGASTECRLDGPSGTGTYAACSSPDLLTLTQGDGTYVFRVRATDVAGNTGAAASKTYALDTAAPAAPSVSGPASPGNSSSVTFTFTAEAGATTSCRLTGPVSVGAWASCASPVSLTLSQGQGTYTYEVRATDAAGNAGAIGSASYVLDTTPPAAPLVSGATGPSNVTNVAWSFTTDPQTTTECRRLLDGSAVTGWAACTSPQNVTLASGDGTYSLEVRATDLAGNTGPVGVSPGYVLDTTGPVAPTITSSPVTPSTGRSPGWAFTLPEGSGQCRFVRGATVIVDWVGCSSPQAYDLTGQPDGTYTFQVRAVDAAGNPGAVATSSFVLDTTAPAAPVVTTVTASPGSTTTPSFSFAGEALSTAHCRLLQNGTEVVPFAPCASPDVVDLSARPDATYTLEVYVTDQAGNDGPAGSSDYTLDRVAPAAPSIDSGPGTVGSDTTPTWSFSGEAGAVFTCRVDGPSSTGTYATCTSPYTPTLSQGDGGYTFLVRAADAAGNVSPAATSNYLLDTTGPAAPVVSGPSGPSSNSTTSFTFTAEAGASTACRVDGPAGVGTFAACTSPITPTLSQGDGTYVVRVQATDPSGNAGAIGSASYLLDTAAPAAPVVTGPAGPASNTSVSWTFTAEAGASTECRLTGPGGAGSWVSCTSPYTQTLGQGDGSYTLAVRATDAAGNVGPAGSSSYLLDTTGPAAPSITGPASPGNDTTPTFTFTAEAGATTQCRVVGPVSTTTWAACTSPRTPSLGQGDGSYQFQVRATDPSGNTGAVGSVTYVLDTQAPVAPTASGPASPGNSAAVSFTFTTEAAATTECKLTGPGTPGVFAACTSPYAATLTGGDGNYTFSVRATDAAGNTGPATNVVYQLDTAAPTAPTVTGPASPGNDTTPTFTFNTPAGTATLECRLDGPGGAGLWAACTSPQTPLLTQGDGVYTFLVRATDAAGNISTPGSVAYTLDTVAPVAPTVSGPAGPSSTTSVSWTFTAEAGATTQCRLFLGGSAVTAWSNCTSPKTYNLSFGDGSYTVQVAATDPAGNLGPAGSSPAYLLDTQAPSAPTLSGPSSPGKATTVTYTFTAEAGATTECRLDGPGGNGPWVSCTSPAVRTLSQGDGAYVFRVRATDAAGNTGPTSAVGYTLDTVAPLAPTITASPTSPGKSRAPSWSFTLPEGSGLCQVSRGGTIVAPYAACSAPFVADLTGQPDGTYTFSVEAVDTAGNAGPAATSTYVLDTTPPLPFGFSPASGTRGNDTTPTWIFTVESGATTQCEVMRGTTVIVAAATCTSPYTVDLSSSGDGTYTLQVWATDVAGNTGGPVTVTYTLDTAPPPPPTITSAPPSVANDPTPTWTFTAEVGAATQCRLTPDGTTPGAWSTCTSPYVGNLATAPDGTYDFEVRAIDVAGNIGSSTTRIYTFDTTAPPAPTLVSAPGSPSKSLTPSWGFSAEVGATAACELDGPSGVVTAWSTCTSPYAVDLTGLSDGVYTFNVRATDAAGNTGPALVVSYTLDSTAPGTPTILTAPSGPAADRTPTWTFSGEPGATFTCTISRGTATVVSPVSCASPYTADLSGQPDGTYTLTVTATDVSGNTSAGSTASYILDTTPPGLPHFTRVPASPDRLRTPAWSWAHVVGTTSTCRLTHDGVVVVNWRSCTSPYVADLAGKTDGTYTLAVRLTDVAGNTGPAATSGYVLDTTAPPLAALTVRPSARDSDRRPSWSWSQPGGTTASCLLTRSGRVLRDWSSCSTPYTANLSGQPDGTYRLSVRFIDAAGNAGPVASSNYTLDTSTPPPPSSGGSSGGGGTGGGGGPSSPSTSGRTSQPAAPAAPVVQPRLPIPGLGAALPGPRHQTTGRAALKPSGKAPEQSSSRQLFSPQLPPVGDVPTVIGQVAVKSLEKPQFPLLLLVVVALFLLIQNRIDRKDPKLASAPVESEPLLGFGPAVGAP